MVIGITITIKSVLLQYSISSHNRGYDLMDLQRKYALETVKVTTCVGIKNCQIARYIVKKHTIKHHSKHLIVPSSALTLAGKLHDVYT